MATLHSNIAKAHILTWAENPRQVSTTVFHLPAVSFDSEALWSIIPRDSFSLRHFNPDQNTTSYTLDPILEISFGDVVYTAPEDNLLTCCSTERIWD